MEECTKKAVKPQSMKLMFPTMSNSFTFIFERNPLEPVDHPIHINEKEDIKSRGNMLC